MTLFFAMHYAMTLERLSQTRVAKPWGRHKLWPGFENPSAGEEPVGEIWFADPSNAPAPLMVKYLFTSERLSIQVHPSDAFAQARGYVSGKEECWIVLDAEADAEIGIGLHMACSTEALHAAALDGSIVDLIDWKPVQAGDVISVPVGTVHAIGAGVTLIEVQQNVDLTYRLYDYGRPRALHLDDGMAVARPSPFAMPLAPLLATPGRTMLSAGDNFSVENISGPMTVRIATPDAGIWIIPVVGEMKIDDEPCVPGQCWFATDAHRLTLEAGARALIATPA
jgi:mannose-6-phosphate isomerase